MFSDLHFNHLSIVSVFYCLALRIQTCSGWKENYSFLFFFHFLFMRTPGSTPAVTLGVQVSPSENHWPRLDINNNNPSTATWPGHLLSLDQSFHWTNERREKRRVVEGEGAGLSRSLGGHQWSADLVELWPSAPLSALLFTEVLLNRLRPETVITEWASHRCCSQMTTGLYWWAEHMYLYIDIFSICIEIYINLWFI